MPYKFVHNLIFSFSGKYMKFQYEKQWSNTNSIQNSLYLAKADPRIAWARFIIISSLLNIYIFRTIKKFKCLLRRSMLITSLHAGLQIVVSSLDEFSCISRFGNEAWIWSGVEHISWFLQFNHSLASMISTQEFPHRLPEPFPQSLSE